MLLDSHYLGQIQEESSMVKVTSFMLGIKGGTMGNEKLQLTQRGESAGIEVFLNTMHVTARPFFPSHANNINSDTLYDQLINSYLLYRGRL